MGTRADFYIGRGAEAQWIGSTAFDGYPDGIPGDVLGATDLASYLRAVGEYLGEDDSSTSPPDPWPWPWETSATTDYAYAFDGDLGTGGDLNGAVYGSSCGHPWFRLDVATEDLGEPEADSDESGPRPVFPDMTEDRDRATNAYRLARSGLIVIAGES